MSRPACGRGRAAAGTYGATQSLQQRGRGLGGEQEQRAHQHQRERADHAVADGHEVTLAGEEVSDGLESMSEGGAHRAKLPGATGGIHFAGHASARPLPGSGCLPDRPARVEPFRLRPPSGPRDRSPGGAAPLSGRARARTPA